MSGRNGVFSWYPMDAAGARASGVPLPVERFTEAQRYQIERRLRRGDGIKAVARHLRTDKRFHGASLTARDVRTISKQIGTHSLANVRPATKAVKSNISAKTRRFVNVRDRMKCRYCGKETFPQAPGVSRHERYSIDHVLPLALGGRNNRTNLVVACHECNNRKGGKTVEEAGMTLLPVPT